MGFQKNVGIAAIVAATLSAGFAVASKKEADKLAGDGLVEINLDPTTQSAAGVQVRATQKAIDAQKAADAAPVVAPKVKPTFEIESGVQLPAATSRGRAVGSVYPFDQLEVGQSFFVANEPKKLNSTVSAAKARYAVEVPGETRVARNGETVPKTKFVRNYIVRPAEKDGVKGARIFRVADVV